MTLAVPEPRHPRPEAQLRTRRHERGHHRGDDLCACRLQAGLALVHRRQAGAGTDSCQVAHNGYVISGRFAVRMDDGTEARIRPGRRAVVGPGHDAWVVGDEPCVLIDVAPADSRSATRRPGWSLPPVRHRVPRPAARPDRRDWSPPSSSMPAARTVTTCPASTSWPSWSWPEPQPLRSRRASSRQAPAAQVKLNALPVTPLEQVLGSCLETLGAEHLEAEHVGEPVGRVERRHRPPAASSTCRRETPADSTCRMSSAPTFPSRVSLPSVRQGCQEPTLVQPGRIPTAALAPARDLSSVTGMPAERLPVLPRQNRRGRAIPARPRRAGGRVLRRVPGSARRAPGAYRRGAGGRAVTARGPPPGHTAALRGGRRVRRCRAPVARQRSRRAHSGRKAPHFGCQPGLDRTSPAPA